MEAVEPLQSEELYRRCDPAQFSFENTDDLGDLVDFIGQDRPIKAIELGIGIQRKGYNIFALGPSGTGKYTLLSHFIEQRAAQQPAPHDWCYVNNFDQPYIPRALRMPTGKGKELRSDMARLVEDLQNALSSALESEEYQNRRHVLEEELQERQQESLKMLQETAQERNLTLLRTPTGLAFAPVREGNVLDPEAFQKLGAEEQSDIQEEIEKLQEELQRILLQVPRWEREFRQQLRELNQEVTKLVLDDLVGDLYEKYTDLPGVLDYLHAVRKDVSEHLEDFLSPTAQAEAGSGEAPASDPSSQSTMMRRYQVNVLVDTSDAQGAPVIYESNPTYLNLVGRVEQMAMMGALVTDYTLIKPGVLHRANGGYLILDAHKVLSSPNAWEGLKRALQFDEIRIESASQMLSLSSTVSLEPEPIPLDIKVILMGDRSLYYTLTQVDIDFNELFKIAADFDDSFTRDAVTEARFAQLVATIVRKEELLPFDKAAVCRVIEQGARWVGDSDKLSARMQETVDLLEEAEHWALQEGAQIVGAQHVQEAIDAQVYRANRVQRRMQEDVQRETIFIDTVGEEVGQINALSVIQIGNYAFGRASWVTASARMGRGDVVDIEREVDLGGPLHSKGVLILASFLRSRYAEEQPLALGASSVFEQSYSGVDGDSASSTELYALLSAIAQVPIKQSLAVTGSVNQHGEVQAIGGVNEKIESFFDLCQARELTGEQGVMIPASNVKHLMLRHDVVEAVREGQFHIFPIEHIDQGIEVLTGVTAGEKDADGHYPDGTINRLVADRLEEFAKTREKMNRSQGAEQDGTS